MSSSTPEQVQAARPGGDPPPPRRGGLYRVLLLATALTVLVIAAAAIPAYLVLRRDHDSALAQTRVSGIPASVSPAWRTSWCSAGCPRTGLPASP